MDEIKTLKYDGYFGREELALEIGNYLNNKGLYIGLHAKTEDGYEPYGDLTVNLSRKAPDYCGYVDLNNMPELEKFIEEHRLGEFTGIMERSGFCEYPLYMFDVDRLRELSPEGMAQYEANIGMARKPQNKEIAR